MGTVEWKCSDGRVVSLPDFVDARGRRVSVFTAGHFGATVRAGGRQVGRTVLTTDELVREYERAGGVPVQHSGP